MSVASGSPFPMYRGTETESASAGPVPRITSLLIKPASAVCNLDCSYCFYLDREADPYKSLPARRMTFDTLERLVDSYLFYSYPNSIFAFQGGEPTLAGLPFFEKLVPFQQHHGRNGQSVSNALQTNAMLLDQSWCDLFRAYHWLLGVSLDGPEEVNDRYRFNKEGRGTWKRVMQSVELLQKNKVEFNILCVLSQANVGTAKELYRFYRSLGIDNVQYIPLAEFDAEGNPLPFTITAAAVRPLPLRDFRPVVAGAAADADSLFRQHRRGAGRAEAGHLHDARNLRQLRGGGVQRRRLPVRFLRGTARGSWATSSWIRGPRSPAAPAATVSPPRKRWRIPNARSANTSRSATAAAPSSATARTATSTTWTTSARPTKWPSAAPSSP